MKKIIMLLMAASLVSVTVSAGNGNCDKEKCRKECAAKECADACKDGKCDKEKACKSCEKKKACCAKAKQ